MEIINEFYLMLNMFLLKLTPVFGILLYSTWSLHFLNVDYCQQLTALMDHL